MGRWDLGGTLASEASPKVLDVLDVTADPSMAVPPQTPSRVIVTVADILPIETLLRDSPAPSSEMELGETFLLRG